MTVEEILELVDNGEFAKVFEVLEQNFPVDNYIGMLKQDYVSGGQWQFAERLRTYVGMVFNIPELPPQYTDLMLFCNKLHIKNFQGIKDLETPILPDKTPWLFVTGENGFGKTSLLRAIALGLVGYETHNFVVSSFSDIEISVYTEGKNNTVKLKKYITRFPYLPNIVAYGAYRLGLEEQENSKQTQSATKSLFETAVPLKNIELSLAEWSLKQDIPNFKEKFENVTKTIKKIIPSIAQIIVKREIEGTPVFYQEQDENGNLYPEMRFSQLASGYRSLIALVGDMILRLFAQQPNTTNPEDLVGIVIIDELDLHFHPKIQRRLPSLLSDCFPKVQFIASTHSPIPILGAPERSAFWRVNRTPERGIFVEDIQEQMIVNIQELTPDLLLTSPVFGFEDIIPEAYFKTKKLRAEEHYKQIEINENTKAYLKEVAQKMKND